jgi:hypothetical protein
VEEPRGGEVWGAYQGRLVLLCGGPLFSDKELGRCHVATLSVEAVLFFQPFEEQPILHETGGSVNRGLDNFLRQSIYQIST